MANTNPEEAEKLTTIAKDFLAFKDKNIDFFEPDIKKLITLRGARTARTLEQSSFIDGVRQFAIDTPKAGYNKVNVQPPIAGISNVYFPKDVAQFIEKMYTYTMDNKALGRLFNTLNDVQNLWKTMALSLRPSTFLRNFIGNIMNSLLAVNSPADLMVAMKDSVLALKNKDYKILTKTGKNIPLQQIKKEAIDRGILSGTFKELEQGRGLSSVLEGKYEPAETVTGKALDVIGGGAEKLASKIRELPAPISYSRSNEIAEQTNKLALFIDAVRQGKSYDDAAEYAYKYLFDYSDMTEIGKKVKSVMPFFTWMRKNLPLQIANLAKEPNRAIIRGQYIYGMQQNEKERVDERFQSDFLKNKAKIKLDEKQLPILNMLDKSKPNYLLLEGLLPVFDVDRVIRAAMDQKAIYEDLISDISPLIKTPIENITNYSFQTKKPLSKSKYDQVEYLGMYMPPWMKNILDDWTILTTANKGLDFDPETIATNPKNLASMMAAYMIGSVTPYDINLSRVLQKGDANKAILNEINANSTFLKKFLLAVKRSGKKPTKKDSQVVFGRGKNIMYMITQAYDEGKINRKEKAKYIKMVLEDYFGDIFTRGE